MAAPHAGPSSGAGAAVDLRSCLACGSVCEITGAFRLPAQGGGDEAYVRTRCVLGHRVVTPAFAVRD